MKSRFDKLWEAMNFYAAERKEEKMDKIEEFFLRAKCEYGTTAEQEKTMLEISRLWEKARPDMLEAAHMGEVKIPEPKGSVFWRPIEDYTGGEVIVCFFNSCHYVTKGWRDREGYWWGIDGQIADPQYWVPLPWFRPEENK